MAGKITTVTLSCPNQSCEADFEVPVRELHKAAVFAASHKKQLIAAACPKCCHVVTLLSEAPTNPDDLQEWIDKTADSDNWLECLPIRGTLARIPAGYIKEGGEILYQPGDAGDSMERRDYMYAEGIDPLCYLKQKGRAPEGT